MRIIDYVRGWLAAAVAYVLAERAVTLLVWVAGSNAHWQGSVFESEGFGPWVAPAVLSVLAAIAAVRRKVRAEWWKWLILTVVVPAVGGAVAISLALNGTVRLTEILPWVVTHVALAGVLGISVGSILTKVRTSAASMRRAR